MSVLDEEFDRFMALLFWSDLTVLSIVLSITRPSATGLMTITKHMVENNIAGTSALNSTLDGN